MLKLVDLLAVHPAEKRFSSQPESFIRIVDTLPRLVPEVSDVMTTGDYAVVEAARVSYSGTKKQSDVRTLLRHLLRHKHTSPFEMIEVKWHMAMPIFTARQWIRHRTANVNEVSGRYSVMKELFYVSTLENLRKQSNTNKQGGSEPMDPVTAQQLLDKETEHDRRCYELYTERVKSGMARELARNVLPLNLYTEWYWKLDMHNTMHFLMLRKDSHAQLEIREMAQGMYDLLQPMFPLCMEAFDDFIDMDNTVRLSRLEVARVQKKEFEPKWFKEGSDVTREEQEFQDKIKRLGLV